jgi:hypothetical protein
MLRPRTPQPAANELHPGISMHRIRAVYAGVGDGPAALLAALGAILVCLVGFPHARWFLVGSILFGLAATTALRAWYRHRAVEVKRLSIRQ